MAESDVLKLGARPLRLSELRRVYESPLTVAIAPEALAGVRAAHLLTARLAAAEAPAYGINTGFGALANTRIAPAQRALLQRNIILSHSAGVGPLLGDPIVRLTLVLKLASLLQGFSGVSEALVRFLERLINHGLLPCVPAQGFPLSSDMRCIGKRSTVARPKTIRSTPTRLPSCSAAVCSPKRMSIPRRCGPPATCSGVGCT